MKQVSNFNDLQIALLSGEKNIQIKGVIPCNNSLILTDGVSIIGTPNEVSILTFRASDGIGLTSNNSISDLAIHAPSNQRAIYTTISQEDLGAFFLKNLTIIGQIQFITRIGTMRAQLIADNIDIPICDAREGIEQPQKYGVNVLQGAFTVYNFNGNPESILKATLTNISLGRKNAPVYGSGLFVSGFGDTGGLVEADLITTNDIYTNGMLPYGVADYITGGLFIVYGTKVHKVINKGVMTTYGVNDMVLDNWGYVKNWLCEKPIQSYGPSGIGFVNFGIVETFEAKDILETYGLGARGFNQYDGTIGSITFKSITTYADGSIGIQISKPVGNVIIKENIVTHGSIGTSLLKGVLVDMPAYAFSIKSGGSVKKLSIGNNITTSGDNISTLDIQAPLENIKVGGKIIANGKNAHAIDIYNNISFNVDYLDIEAPDGKTIVNK